MKSKIIPVSILFIFLLMVAFIKPLQTRVVDNMQEMQNISQLANVVYLIAFDESESMAPYFQEAKSTLNKSLDNMNAKDLIYVYTFGTDVKELLSDKEIGKDKEEIKKQISSIRMVNDGWTYLANMLEKMTYKMEEINRKYKFHNRLLIIYSDNVNDPPPQFVANDSTDLRAHAVAMNLMGNWGKYVMKVEAQPINSKKYKDISDKKQLPFFAFIIGATEINVNNKNFNEVIGFISKTYGPLQSIQTLIAFILFVYLIHILTNHFIKEYYSTVALLFLIILITFSSPFYTFIQSISNNVKLIPNFINNLMTKYFSEFGVKSLWLNIAMTTIMLYLLFWLIRKIKGKLDKVELVNKTPGA